VNAHMASTKREYAPNQLHKKQRKSDAVPVPFWRRSFIGYLACLPLVGLAMLGSLLEQQLGLHAYFSSAPLLLAVVLIALLWGAGPALLAIVVSILVLDYIDVPPTGSFDFHTWDGLLQVFPFLLSGACIALITAQRETARRHAVMAEQEVDSYADKLELDNRLLNAVIVQASRELRASLHNIPQHVQVLRHQLPVWQEQALDRDGVQHVLEQIDMQTGHLQALNASLLSLTKDRAGAIGTLTIPYDLRTACRALLADLSLDEGRSIEIEVPSHPIMLYVEYEDLRRVLVHVVRHVLRHSSPDGIVQVCVSQDEEHAHIQVREAKAKQTQAHEQYQIGSRQSDLHAESRDGSDLWYVISQTIIEWYNGRIRHIVSSDGEGCSCSIELPAC
jgi:K+-sensing histidine kinase KdpD